MQRRSNINIVGIADVISNMNLFTQQKWNSICVGYSTNNNEITINTDNINAVLKEYDKKHNEIILFNMHKRTANPNLTNKTKKTIKLQLVKWIHEHIHLNFGEDLTKLKISVGYYFSTDTKLEKIYTVNYNTNK